MFGSVGTWYFGYRSNNLLFVLLQKMIAIIASSCEQHLGPLANL
uniref:Uncharacterized protein n=1 Tax=Arundo donax TaxID=35708 RepID=A0A0A9E7I3_ARUDO